MIETEEQKVASLPMVIDAIHWMTLRPKYERDEMPPGWDYEVLLQGPQRGVMLGGFFNRLDGTARVCVNTSAGMFSAQELGMTEIAIVSTISTVTD